MKKLILCSLFALIPTTAHGMHWTRCTISNATGEKHCHHFHMKTQRKYGSWKKCTVGSEYTRCVTHPILKPNPIPNPTTTVTLWITGYSFGCGVSGRTADGSAAVVGSVSSDNPTYWHRYIYVPSLGYSGFVNDRGVGTGGMDLLVSSCSAALSITGWRAVDIR